MNQRDPGERPEHRLLVACSRTVLDEEQKDLALALLRDERLHWGNLVVMAGYHGVQPLLYAHLRGLDEELLSEEHMTWLRGVVGARSAHSLVLLREIGSLAALFDREGLPFIVVKGPVLALAVYGGLAIRPFADLDLVIAPTDYARVEAVLAGQGYHSRAMGAAQKRSYLYIHGQYTFWRRLTDVGNAHVFLDVHTAVMPPGYTYTERFESLLERARPLVVGGAEVQTLEPEDLLIVLSFHGFKSRWDRLKYVCDVAEVIHAYPDLDWDAVFERARAMHSQRIVRLNLYLAMVILDARLPERVRNDVLGDAHVIQLGTAIAERMPRQATMKVEPYLDRVRLNLFGQDSLLGGIRYGAYAAVRRLSELYLPASE